MEVLPMANAISGATSVQRSAQVKENQGAKNSSKSLSNAKPPAPQDKVTISVQARAAQAANKGQSSDNFNKK
jgi:hypothetical protein